LWIASLAVLLAGGALNAQEVTGDWLGTLKAGPSRFAWRCIFRKRRTAACRGRSMLSIRE